LQAKDKLGILHSQMAVFIEPLYFAFFFENTQGPLHSRLASALETTSWFVNDTVSYIRRKVRLRKVFYTEDNREMRIGIIYSEWVTISFFVFK